jgi:hypothetical protein
MLDELISDNTCNIFIESNFCFSVKNLFVGSSSLLRCSSTQFVNSPLKRLFESFQISID